MRDTSHRVVWGIVGLIVGLVMGSGVPWRLQPPGINVLGAHSFIMPMLFVTFWLLLIFGAIKWLLMGSDRSRGRLADLPADFDDWHRRAHAQMAREAASADDPGRRG